MSFSTTGKNYMLDQIGSVITHVELWNNTPAMEDRQALSLGWESASGGSKCASDSSGTVVVFDVTAGKTVNNIKLVNSTGATVYAEAPIDAESFNNAGTYTLTELKMELTDS